MRKKYFGTMYGDEYQLDYEVTILQYIQIYFKKYRWKVPSFFFPSFFFKKLLNKGVYASYHIPHTILRALKILTNLIIIITLAIMTIFKQRNRQREVK